MISHATPKFWRCFRKLPDDVQQAAEQAFALFERNPQHPSLRFKCVQAEASVWSVRIGLHYRALGTREADEMVWFWVGTHAAYDQMLERM